MSSIIEISNLNKSYGDVKAVQNLSFKVKEGELFAFLGVNGAGKSTTISVICGTLSKDSGTVIIDGADIEKDPDAVKKNIGVVFQNSVLDKSLSVRDNLESRAALYGIYGTEFKQKLDYLADLLGFNDILNRTVSKLSGGQRRKIDIARALLHDPKILILDEPTTGLDPQTRIAVWNVVDKFRKERNMTVFLTTHYMEEAADADYVVIMDGGKIVAEGTPLDLKNKYTGDFIYVYDIDDEKAATLGIPFVNAGVAYKFAVKDTAQATELILKHPDFFTDYEITKGKMDLVFLEVTGKTLAGESVK